MVLLAFLESMRQECGLPEPLALQRLPLAFSIRHRVTETTRVCSANCRPRDQTQMMSQTSGQAISLTYSTSSSNRVNKDVPQNSLALFFGQHPNLVLFVRSCFGWNRLPLIDCATGHSLTQDEKQCKRNPRQAKCPTREEVSAVYQSIGSCRPGSQETEVDRKLGEEYASAGGFGHGHSRALTPTRLQDHL